MADRAAPAAAQAGPVAPTGDLPIITATVRYFAAARAAAGVAQESVLIPLPAAPGEVCTIGLLLDILVARHGPELARVLQRCSYLLDEVAVHGMGTVLREGQVLDVLPPFAGG